MKPKKFIQKMAMAGIGAVFFLAFLAPISGHGAVAPELLWERRYDSLSDDIVYDVTVDNFNNIIVTGMSNKNYYTIKYDSISGNPLWEKLYDSGFTDAASGVVVDSKNNIIVTGSGGLFNNNNSLYRTIKYDSNGSQLWTDIFGLGENSSASDISVDSSDNVVITGYFLNFSFNKGYHADILTIKYDASGRRLWYKIYDKGRDTAYGVAIDSKDNVIVTGVSDWDFFTIKYDANGNELWSKTLDNGSDDSAFSVAVDSLDNIIVAGSSHILADNKDYTFLIKYDSNGRELWRRNYEDASWNKTLSVAVDSLNNIIVARVRRFNGNYNYYTIASDPAGNILWEKIYDGGSIDMAVGAVVDSMDNVIVTGRSSNGQNYDYLTLKYGYPVVLSPLASFTATPFSGLAPLSVNFTDTSTPAGQIDSWLWNFGDGQTSSQKDISYTYNTAGTYAVSLTVSNQAGSDTKIIPNYITVTAPDITSPTISITDPFDNAIVQDTIIIKAAASDSDNRGVNRVEWDIDNTFRFADNTSPYEYFWDTTTVSDGLHQIKAKAYDAAGNSAEDNITVKVNNAPPPVNRPPVLNPIGNKIIDEGQLLTFAISASDADNDTLIYSAANLPSGATFNPGTRTFSWTPDNSQSGTYSNIHFEVSDGRLTDFENITITVNDVVIPRCFDGLDNDGDGLIDYPSDPGCSSSADNDEIDIPVNHPPIANAGPDQTAEGNNLVQLNGSASFDPDHDLLTYQWTQISGQRVSLGDSNQDIASFIAPELISAQAMEFQLTVTDPGNLSSNDTAIITVKPKPEVKPAIKITQPQDNSIVAPRLKVTITANVQDNGNLVKNVSFLVNHKTYRASKNRQGAYYYNWTVPYGYSKTYNIKVQAKDKQKNIVADDSVTIPSSHAPRISLTEPQNNQTVLPRTSIPVTANLSPDNIGITKVEFYINNQRKHTDRNSPYSYNWRVPKQTNQTYNIQAIAFTRDEDFSRDILVGESETIGVRTE